MKLRQLVLFHEVIRQDFNVSAAAKAAFASQPVVSRQLQDLAAELRVDLFLHRGKRLVGLTPAGAEIAGLAEEVVRTVRRIELTAAEFATGERGDLRIVASRYAAATQLREALVRRAAITPRIDVRVFEAEPESAAAKLLAGEADIGLMTEPSVRHSELMYFPLERWELLLVAPRDHPVVSAPAISLPLIASYQCCSYDESARSRQLVEETFCSAGLASPVVFSLGSSESILDYVAAGVGIGIVAASAFVAEQRPQLVGLEVRHLFRALTTDLVLPKRSRLSKEVYRITRLLKPNLSWAQIERARADAQDYPGNEHDTREPPMDSSMTTMRRRGTS